MYIDYKFKNWNEYINIERSNKYWASKTKKEEAEIIGLLCRNIKPIEKYPIKITFIKYYKHKNNDIDNIRVKGLIDGLVKAGILKNDNMNYIEEITLKGKIDKERDGIEIIIEEMI